MKTPNYTDLTCAFNWRCSKGDAHFTQTYRVYPGQELVNPQLPDGWTRVGDAIYCPKHTVVLLVDGEAVKL